MGLHWEPQGPVRGRIALLHGLSALSPTWWRIGPALADRGWDVSALDLPGHGEAPRLTEALDLEGLAADIGRRLKPPVDVLIGHSLGALAVLALASRQPDVARALVLEEPPGQSTLDMDALIEGLIADDRLARSDRDLLLARERQANPRWVAEDVEHSVQGIEAMDTEAVAASLQLMRGWDLAALIEAVRVPVLVLAAPDHGRPEIEGQGSLGGQDRAAVEALLPADRFVVLDGGHCLHRDTPEAWLDAVTAFADSALASG